MHYKGCSKERVSEKAKPIVRWGRKATGLLMQKIAGLPEVEMATRFFIFLTGYRSSDSLREDLEKGSDSQKKPNPS